MFGTCWTDAQYKPGQTKKVKKQNLTDNKRAKEAHERWKIKMDEEKC